MDKYLTPKKDEFKYVYHNTLTFASMLELEGKSLEDREEIMGVFLNRIDKKMALGSDVTETFLIVPSLSNTTPFAVVLEQAVVVSKHAIINTLVT